MPSARLLRPLRHLSPSQRWRRTAADRPTTAGSTRSRAKTTATTTTPRSTPATPRPGAARHRSTGTGSCESPVSAATSAAVSSRPGREARLRGPGRLARLLRGDRGYRVPRRRGRRRRRRRLHPARQLGLLRRQTGLAGRLRATPAADAASDRAKKSASQRSGAMWGSSSATGIEARKTTATIRARRWPSRASSGDIFARPARCASVTSAFRPG